MENKEKRLFYRPVGDADNNRWLFAAGLDEMRSTGCYNVQLWHGNDVGELPLPACDDEHYIVATLIVTESGTADKLQKNRAIGQTLILSQCNDGQTGIYYRSLAPVNGNFVWSEWNALLSTGQFNEIADGSTNITLEVKDNSVTAKKLSHDLIDQINRNTSDVATLAKTTEMELDETKRAIGLVTQETVIKGETQSGYINADSGYLFLLSTNKSVYYVPVIRGERYRIAIPKTSDFGSSYGFVEKVASQTMASPHVNVGNGVYYVGDVEAPIDGYLILCFMPNAGTPSVARLNTASTTLDTLRDLIGTVVPAGTDAGEDIALDNDRYSISGRKFVAETAYVGKKYIPVELGITDYRYESSTGVPANQDFLAAFNSDKKLVCAVVNTTGAYIKSALLRDYIPEALWAAVKYVCVNCYSTNIATARITVKNIDDYVVKNEENVVYDIMAGKTLDVRYYEKIKGSNVLQSDYVKVNLSGGNGLYLVTSGYFNTGAGDKLEFYDDLKRLIKSVPANEISYLVPNSSIAKSMCVCISDYIEEDYWNAVAYVRFSNYCNVSFENSFINIFYTADGFTSTIPPSLYRGKVLLTYGDSVTEGVTWQKQLASVKGLQWDERTSVRADETLVCGVEVYHYEVAGGDDKDKVCFEREDGAYYYFADDGTEVDISHDNMVAVRNRSTGISGSMIVARPQNGLNYRCVYKRIQEAQSFKPDVILIYGTYNDVKRYATDSERETFYGTVDDEAYYGLPKDGVTFAASLKGIFEMLSRTCPLAKVVYVGVYTFLNDPTSKEAWDAAHMDCLYQNNLAKDICLQYSIPFVDLQAEFGHNWYNHMRLMSNSSPHPNGLGGDRTAEIIATRI